VVDRRGNAYIGNTGVDFPEGAFAPGTLALASPDGSVRQLADGLAVPNGVAVTPDNQTLIIAESYGNCLTTRDIAADGSLSHGRVWARLGGDYPDGMCLDAKGVSRRPILHTCRRQSCTIAGNAAPPIRSSLRQQNWPDRRQCCTPRRPPA